MFRAVLKIEIPLLTRYELLLPFADKGLSWLLPSIGAIVLMKAFDLVTKKKAY